MELNGEITLAADAAAPRGSCNQIKITAFRTYGYYDSPEPLHERESTFARGPSLVRCTYSLMVPSLVRVRFDATTTIPLYKVVLARNENTSTTGEMSWTEMHPITVNWKLKPLRPGPMLAPGRRPAR